MSSNTWTQDALRSSATELGGRCWRVVEAQHQISTMKITDTLAEQAVLEELLEETKQPIPRECAHLDFLLLTPFRYSAEIRMARDSDGRTPSRGVLRGRAPRNRDGRDRLSPHAVLRGIPPSTPWPANASEYTAFSCAFEFDRVTDMREDAGSMTPVSITSAITARPRCSPMPPASPVSKSSATNR